MWQGMRPKKQLLTRLSHGYPTRHYLVFLYCVIPAKTGNQVNFMAWIPVFTGMTEELFCSVL